MKAPNTTVLIRRNPSEMASKAGKVEFSFYKRGTTCLLFKTPGKSIILISKGLQFSNLRIIFVLASLGVLSYPQ